MLSPGGLAVIYQDVVPTGDARLMGGGGWDTMPYGPDETGDKYPCRERADRRRRPPAKSTAPL